MKTIKIMRTMVTGKLDSFNKFALFTSLLLFLIFFLIYRDALSSVVLAIVFHIYLRLTHFVFEVIEKVLGEVGNGVE